jgi:hypothetical protein
VNDEEQKNNNNKKQLAWVPGNTLTTSSSFKARTTSLMDSATDQTQKQTPTL